MTEQLITTKIFVGGIALLTSYANTSSKESVEKMETEIKSTITQCLEQKVDFCVTCSYGQPNKS